MDFESPESESKLKSFLVVVVIAFLLLGGGVAFVLYKRKTENDAVAQTEQTTATWCAARKEWGKKANDLSAEIMIAFAKNGPSDAVNEVLNRRDQFCREYAAKVKAQNLTDPRIQEVEIALVKEGKVRANISVEISNALTRVDAEDIVVLKEGLEETSVKLKQRIKEKQAAADSEIQNLLNNIPGCKDIYRGPLTDANTSDSPYISWEELEMRRAQAEKQFQAKVADKAPEAEFADRISGVLKDKYKAELATCFKTYKKKRPEISDEAYLRIRLKSDGGVKTLALEKMAVREEGIIDCLLKTAAKWKFPKPQQDDQKVVVKVEFASL